jgi:hypothetical protein
MPAYLLEGWEISTARGRPRSELLNQRDVHSKRPPGGGLSLSSIIEPALPELSRVDRVLRRA